MASIRALAELLDALEDHWRSQRVPVAAHLRPGLTDERIRQLTGPVGVRLPDEVRAWWRRHDGVAREDSRRGRDREVTGSLAEYIPLAEAVETYYWLRERARDMAGSFGDDPTLGDPDFWWHRAWFPVTVSRSGISLACDCSVPPGESSPIRAVTWHDDAFGKPRASSFAELIAAWVEAFDTGATYYDADEGRWHDVPEDAPERYRPVGLE